MKIQNQSVSLEGDESYSHINPHCRNNVSEAVGRLNNVVMRKVLEKIISAAFSEEYEFVYQERQCKKRVQVRLLNELKLKQKLKRLAELKDVIAEREEIKKQECFLRWKRSDYLMMLESLQAFNSNIGSLYQVRI